MKNVKKLETVERERESYILNKVACINVANLNKIYFRNKDPCYGLRLIYLGI